jgi:hypothetical protein
VLDRGGMDVLKTNYRLDHNPHGRLRRSWYLFASTWLLKYGGRIDRSVNIENREIVDAFNAFTR